MPATQTIIVVVVVVVVSGTPSDANSLPRVIAFAALDLLTENLLTKELYFNTFSPIGKLRIRRYPLLSGIGPTRAA